MKANFTITLQPFAPTPTPLGSPQYPSSSSRVCGNFFLPLDHKWLMSHVAMETLDNECCSSVGDCSLLSCDAV